MERELREQIEKLEQKMLKSPNYMNNGGSHFCIAEKEWLDLKCFNKTFRKKCLQNG